MSEKQRTETGPGPFYIQSDCCIFCGVPQQIAPELFGWKEGLCSIKRQPNTKGELDRIVRVLWSQDLGCLRYSGEDSDILKRFAQLGIAEQCDIAPPPATRREFRNHVTFSVGQDVPDTALDLIEIFKTHLLQQEQKSLEGLESASRDKYRYRFKKAKATRGTCRFSYSWYGAQYHPVELVRLGEPSAEWLIRHSPVEVPGSQGVSFQLHDWLTTDGRFSSVRWYTASGWDGLKQSWELPW